MDFKIRTLRFFVTIAEEGSITRAAQKLYVAQPSLSQRIRAFEDMLGFALFDRSHGQLVLTTEGKAFLPIAKSLVEAAKQAGVSVRNLSKGNFGTLRVGGSWFSLASPERQLLINDFADKNPGIEVIVVRESYSPILLSRLQHRELDVAFVSGPVVGNEFDSISLPPLVPNLLVPIEMEIAKLKEIPPAKLKGLQIAWYRREDNPQLFEATAMQLNKVGAVVVSPPDTHFDAMAPFAQRRRIATFIQKDIESKYPDMVSIPIKGDPISFAWSLVRIKADESLSTQRFWSFVRELMSGED